MTMIFKDGYLREEQFEKIKHEDSLEFCIALQERLNEDSDNHYQIYHIIEGSDSFFGLKKDDNANQYLNIEGNLSFRGTSKLYKPTKKEIDKDKLQHYREMLSDFYQLDFEKPIFDKNGKEYQLKYFSNYSTNQLGYSREDIIKIYDGDNNIGYLKLIYRKQEDHDEISPSTSLKFLIEKNVYGVDKYSDEKSILDEVEYITGKKFCSVNEADKYIEEHYQHIVGEKYDIGTIAYSNISNDSDTSYQSKGLGKIMYFEAAKMLNSKGVSFRASTSQTELAKNLWSSLENNLPNHIGTIKYKGEIFQTLNVKQDEILSYENGKLKINNIEEQKKYKKILKNILA